MSDITEEYCKRFILLDELKYYFSILETDQLQKLRDDKRFLNSLQNLIQNHLKPKPELINESELINNFWKLSVTNRYQILKDILGWSEQQIRNYFEDFGWNTSGIILRKLKEAALLRDFQQEMKKYQT